MPKDKSLSVPSFNVFLKILDQRQVRKDHPVRIAVTFANSASTSATIPTAAEEDIRKYLLYITAEK
ncbi:MAG: hypothetical protein U0930_09670 [Pirellulales bacterium]